MPSRTRLRKSFRTPRATQGIKEGEPGKDPQLDHALELPEELEGLQDARREERRFGSEARVVGRVSVGRAMRGGAAGVDAAEGRWRHDGGRLGTRGPRVSVRDRFPIGGRRSPLA